MRAATLIKRSGWKTEEFVAGRRVEIHGHPHSDDPHSCYLEAVTLGGSTVIDRNDQFTQAPVDTSKRPLRLESGEPNISGDWAVEQAVLTVPPSGGRGDLVPRSVRADYAAGKITLAEIRARNPAPSRPQYTEAGQAAATAFRMWSPDDNPRLSCKPTSIVFDWTFDWPVNRIAQTTVAGEKVSVTICYEDVFGAEQLRYLSEATLLVNVSNVAWFGRSLAPRQHLQISRARALETGRYMLRATNTGVTAVIDPRGEVVAAAPEFTMAAVTQEVEGYRGATPYVRWGNYAALLLCAGLLGLAWFARRRAS